MLFSSISPNSFSSMITYKRPGGSGVNSKTKATSSTMSPCISEMPEVVFVVWYSFFVDDNLKIVLMLY